jgi:hypothetical protein
MPIHIYHPNKNNTGFACAFSQSDKDGTIFATIIKQSGWDSEKSVGSFKDSRNDPTKNVSIKLGQVEVAAILDCLERNRPFSTVHDSDKTIKTIQFVPWLNKPANPTDKPTQRGFSFSISIADKQDSTTKNSLYIGITFPEGRLIREFLVHALQSQFSRAASVADSI